LASSNLPQNGDNGSAIVGGFQPVCPAGFMARLPLRASMAARFRPFLALGLIMDSSLASAFVAASAGQFQQAFADKILAMNLDSARAVV
jgi:hypothetical protein